MPEIAHPDGEGQIAVDVVDTESHRGNHMVQVEATDDSLSLTDTSGEAPWLFENGVDGYEVIDA